MPVFAYRAVDLNGSHATGTLDAPDHESVARELDTRGLVLLDARTEFAEGSLSSFVLRHRVRHSDIVEATRAMASLLRAGLPLSRALETASDVASGAVSAALEDTRARVARGADVHEAMATHPRVFSPLYTGLVHAADRSGDLTGAFVRLADALEREGQLRSKLVSALIYPSLLAGVGAFAVTILLLFVIPRFAGLLTGAGASLPFSTALMLGLAGALRAYWPAFLAFLCAVAAGATWLFQSETGRAILGGLRLRVPIARTFERNRLAAQFARMTGSLVAGGAPLLNALDHTLASQSNPAAKAALTTVREDVRKGSSLGMALDSSAFYPHLLPELVQVGEESGALDEFLLKAAEIFEARTERTLERLVSIVEPAMIVMFGAIVGVIALSLLQAVYGLNPGLVR